LGDEEKVWEDLPVTGVDVRFRKRAGYVIFDNRLYIWGGLKKNKEITETEYTIGCDVIYFNGTELVAEFIDTPPLFYQQLVADPDRRRVISICGLDPTSKSEYSFVAQSDVVSFSADERIVVQGNPTKNDPDRNLFPDSRCGHTCVVVDNLCYIFGGFSESSDQYRFYKSLEFLDIGDPNYEALYSSKELGDKPGQLEFPCGVNIDGKLWIFGGLVAGKDNLDIFTFNRIEADHAIFDNDIGIIFEDPHHPLPQVIQEQPTS